MSRPRPQLELEPLSDAWLQAVREVVADPEVMRFTRFPVPAPDGWAEQWVAGYVRDAGLGTRVAFVAVGPDRRFLGLALAPGIEAEARELELGYLVPAAERGRGVATEILRQLTDWAFGPGNALRASLTIDVANIASQRAAARAGYQLEGVLRSTYFKQGLRTDVQLWGRLADDPEPA